MTTNLEILNKLATDNTITIFDPVCIRQKSNWSKIGKNHKFDNGYFNADIFLKDMKTRSPKLDTLLRKIADLDKNDEKKHGKKFKHFIFSDLRSGGHGAKMLAAGLMASGWTMGYNAALKNPQNEYGDDADDDDEDGDEDNKKKAKIWGPIEMLSDKELMKTRGDNFYLLSSISVFDKPISVKMKKDILSKFNSRPDNIYGDLARIIVMDSGYKEGIDLFDIKYIHIFEPSVNAADQKQVIGRGTRTCGQKGLDFHPTRGWPLHVFVYDLEIPDSLKSSLLGASSTFELFMKSLNINIRLLNFGYDLERLSILGSVDYELNEAVHNFAVNLEDGSKSTSRSGSGSRSKSTSRSGSGSDSNSGSGTTSSISSISNSSQTVFGGKRISPGTNEFIADELHTTPNLPVRFELGNIINEFGPRKGKSIIGHEKMKQIIQKKYGEYTPLKNSNRVAVESSTKLPVTDLNIAPFQGADSNLHRYKWENVKMENMCVEKPTDKSGGGARLIEYTPTQNFIRHYFAPALHLKGMLLYHSVGTGKTCSAIAAATRNFETAGYTILWVTRTTLKNDIWKNMFQQVCNESIRNKIAESGAATIPDDPNKQKRLLSKAWRIRPMSYKQFSNLVSKQNEFYHRLVKENGAADPLRKTLIIIDEAHKLYGGGDLSSLERPDMGALHESLMNSYAISENDSVRLLLMTATPITESPMELIQLINLCKPVQDQMPNTFDNFSDKYLDGEGLFTEKGRDEYLDAIAGHISYLNREKDARQFSQPIIKHIMTPIIPSAEINKVKQFDKYITRTSADEMIGELKEKADIVSAKMEGELGEMDKDSFNYLKKKCEHVDALPNKICQKIIQTNIRELAKEVKSYTQSIRDQIRVLKKEMLNASKMKQKGLDDIKKNIERYPDEFENYKNGAYFSVRTICGKRIHTNKELLDNLKEHPRIIKYNKEIKVYEDNIEMIRNRLKIETESYNKKMKELKMALKKENNLSDLEKSVIKLIIKESKTTFQKTQKKHANQVREELEDHTYSINLLQDKKKEVYKSVKKTMKEMIKKDKKEQSATKKAESRLRKTLRKQGDLYDDIKDEGIRVLVDTYEEKIKEQLDDTILKNKILIKEKEAKEKEKREQKEAKEKEKQQQKEAKQKEKEAKQNETRKRKEAKTNNGTRKRTQK